jgi:hypothetical protein
MNRKLKLSLLLLGFAFLLSSMGTASAAVIEEVIVTGDFGLDGFPAGEQLVYTPQDDDAVYVWFNMTEVYANDKVTFKYIQPSGVVYYTDEWVAFDWLAGESYNTFSEIEVQASPAADLPGMWSLEVYNEDTLWTKIAFEIVSDGASTDSSSDSSDVKIRGYYIWVEDVKTVGDVVIGENATVEITIKYNFPIQSPLVPSIFDDEFQLRGDASDEIQGSGETTYTISMYTQTGDESKVFYAVAYYFVDGNWTFMESGGYMPFTLEGGSSDGTGSPGGIEIPNGFDLSGIDVDQITSTLNDTFQKGLDLLENVEIPEELSNIEETIKEQTGIPGFPVEALIVGATALGYALRKRNKSSSDQ